MATYFNYTFFEPGDSVAGLDTVIQDVVTALNDLPIEAMQEGSLNRNHFDADTHIIANEKGGSLNDYTLVHSGSDHKYTEGTETIDYSAYGTDGATDRNVIGDTTDAGYTGVEASITGLDIDYSAAAFRNEKPLIWAKCNVQVANATSDPNVESVMICLQTRQLTIVGTAAWFTLDRSERFVSRDDHQISTEPMTFDVPIKVMIDSTDLESGYARIDGVRAMVSGTSVGSSAVITLNRWNLTALPVRFLKEN